MLWSELMTTEPADALAAFETAAIAASPDQRPD
jgi:hypothetical protein